MSETPETEPKLREEFRFIEPYIEQVDDILCLLFGFTLWERITEMWEDYSEDS
jgi:hypothetical protein